MAIRNIVKEGDPILNKVCRPVTNFDDRLATLLDDMRETMIDADAYNFNISNVIKFVVHFKIHLRTSSIM